MRLERRTEIGVRFEQRARDAVPDRASLAGRAAARHVHANVILCARLRRNKRLHEKVSGFTVPKKAVATLAAKVEAEGVRILRGVEVTGFDMQGDTVSALRTSHGDIRAELIVIGAGPWTGRLWKMLGLPMTAKVKTADGAVAERPMFTYWKLP